MLRDEVARAAQELPSQARQAESLIKTAHFSFLQEKRTPTGWFCFAWLGLQWAGGHGRRDHPFKNVFRAHSFMADTIDALKAIADEYSIRSPTKLQKQALLEGVRVSIRDAQEALKTDIGRQVFGPKPRSRAWEVGGGRAERPLTIRFDRLRSEHFEKESG